MKGAQKNDEIIWNLYFDKKLWKASLMRKFFWRTLLSVGVQRPDHRKENLYFGENIFFHWILFSLNNSDSFAIIQQRVYTRLMMYKKIFLKKYFRKFSFNKKFWIKLLSVRVQRANAYKWKTVFRVNFFGFRELVVWKTYFECFVKKYQWGTHGWLE